MMLRAEGLRTYTDDLQMLRDVALYPTRYFYPYPWTETFSESCVTPDTYAIHHWDETWKKGRSIKDRLSRLALRTSAQISPYLASHGMRAYVRRQRRAFIS
jgi:hypothetical protein